MGVRKLNTCAAVGLCRGLETVHVQSPAGHRDGNLSQSEHFLWIAADSSRNKQNGAARARYILIFIENLCMRDNK